LINQPWNHSDVAHAFGGKSCCGYDALGRKLSTSINYGAFTLTSSQTYYKNGQKKSYTGADGVTINYTYNISNRLQTISIPGEGSFIYNSYNEFGPTKVTLPGGSTKNYSYDGTLRLTGINAKDPAGNNLMNYGYVYDASGNIVKKTTDAGDFNYAYDGADRLISAQYPAGSGLSNETFTYDKVGNRISHSDSAAWVYNNNDELTSRPNASYAYDVNGNMIKKTEGTVVTDYVYNGENRLTQVKQGATIIASYAYDPSGRRISKTVNGVTTYPFYSDEGLAAEADSTGNVLISYGHKPGQHGSNPLFTKIAGKYYYYLNDYQGMPQQMIAKNGAVVWKASTAAFGDLSISQSTVTNNIRFPGQYADSETGLYDNHFRKYDPSTGRYNRVDPAGSSGGSNSFIYAGVNPLSNIDYLGLWVTTAHNYLIEGLVESLDPAYFKYTNYKHPFYRPLKDGSRDIDKSPYQDADYSYVHSMSSPSFTQGEAFVLAEAFKRLMYQGFCNELPKDGATKKAGELKQYGKDGTKTYRYWAYKYLGFGLHTVMDNTSPKHEKFKFWPKDLWSDHLKEDVQKKNPQPGLIRVVLPHVFGEGISAARERKATTMDNMLRYLNRWECACQK